jgi:alkylated DNA nucleotide flippase Atl1
MGADANAAGTPVEGVRAGVAGGPPGWVERVLDAVAAIPPGAVSTYGDVGRSAGCGPRQVGTALARYGSGVPWWRVLRADGTLAPGLAVEQSRLLAEDGVAAVGARVDLTRYRAES